MSPAAEGETRLAWTDSHCHLQYCPDDEALSAALGRATAAGVDRMIVIGTDEASSRRAIEIAARFPADAAPGAALYATVGLHPHDAKAGTQGVRRLLRDELGGPEALKAARVVGIGECGLDYYYEYSERPVQVAAFAEQVALAHEHDLTLVIHTREAFDETFAVLGTCGVPPRTVFHCFTGGPAEAERCLETGAYLSFSGIVTFQKADEVREAARLCPLGRLLVETDSPYLAPVPHRGKENEPSFVPCIGEVVAAAKAISVSEVARASHENASRAFALEA